MRVLVAYSSKHGATMGIAERIGDGLSVAGHDVDVWAVARDLDVRSYAACVIGSAAYLGHWQRDAAAFVRRNQSLLAGRPTWFFSSGPLGSRQVTDGVDPGSAAEPGEIHEFSELIHPRGHRVLSGALDPGALGLRDRVIRALPAGRALLPEGDFRDWQEIDEWVEDICGELAHLPETIGRA